MAWRRIGSRVSFRRERHVRHFLPNEWFIAVVGRAAPAKRADEQPAGRTAKRADGRPAERPGERAWHPDWLVATLGLALWVVAWAILLMMVVGPDEKRPVRGPFETDREWLER